MFLGDPSFRWGERRKVRLQILSIGRSAKSAERELVERYLKRIPKLAKQVGFNSVTLQQFGESKKANAAERKREETQALLKTADGLIIALDEQGENLSSEEFAALLKTARTKGGTSLNFIIGGPDGLDEDVRGKTFKTIALGKMTWPHQFALAMLMEQIYRALTILSGHPYHRQ